MTSVQRIPRTRVGRLRLVTLIIGLVLTTAPIVQLETGVGSGGATVVSVVSVALLVSILLATAALGRQISVLEGPATGVLVVLVGMGLQNPLGSTGLLVGVVVAQSMYGGKPSEILRVLAFLPVIPASVALSVSPIGSSIGWSSTTCLSLVPSIPVFAALMSLLKSALHSQAEAEDRARFMAALAGDLLPATTIGQVEPVLMRAGTQICEVIPGLVLVAARVEHPGSHPGPATVQRIFGISQEHAPQEIPAEIIAGLPVLGKDEPSEVRGIGRRMRAIGLPGWRKWYAHGDDPVAGQPFGLGLYGVPVSLTEWVFGTPGSRAAERVSILSYLSEHRARTLTFIQDTQALMLTANQDDITGLPTRRTFLHRLDDLLGEATKDSQSTTVAVVLISLDGLIPLATEHGFPAADLAASELAQRLSDIVVDGGCTGQFSDHRFALAVPVPVADNADGATKLDSLSDDLVGLAGLSGLSDLLRRELSAPIRLDGHSLSVSISINIGCALAVSGASGWDLIEHAAEALRFDRMAASDPLVRSP